MNPPKTKPRRPDAGMIRILRKAGLIGEAGPISCTALTGGVSSDIWRIECDGRAICVKRALPKLKVAADWFAPVERNRYETAWFRIANGLVPGSAPRVLFHDDDAMLCATEYFDPSAYRLWKNELHMGHAMPGQASEAGRRLAAIHAGTAGDATPHGQFPRSDIFHAIRLEPYLEATAAKHPDLADELFALSRRTGETKLAMIHGDVSPKNILIGPDGPVFLDAECACIGDPAFDLAFCLNHFLLKCLWTPKAAPVFLNCFAAMTSAYRAGVTWEEPGELEARAASLLPGLFLARIDGKSPVEYITEDEDKDRVRRVARTLLRTPPARLKDVAGAWEKEVWG